MCGHNGEQEAEGAVGMKVVRMMRREHEPERGMGVKKYVRHHNPVRVTSDYI